jgi:hypothetical protein
VRQRWEVEVSLHFKIKYEYRTKGKKCKLTYSANSEDPGRRSRMLFVLLGELRCSQLALASVVCLQRSEVIY